MPKRTAKKPLIAIIIDDLGYDIKLAHQFIELGLPLDLSLLPDAPHTAAVAKIIRKTDCELMLHLPMESKNSSRSDLVNL